MLPNQRMQLQMKLNKIEQRMSSKYLQTRTPESILEDRFETNNLEGIVKAGVISAMKYYGELETFRQKELIHELQQQRNKAKNALKKIKILITNANEFTDEQIFKIIDSVL